MADLEERAPKPLHLIVGMMGLKDAGGFLSAFRGLASHVVTVPIPGAHEAPHAPEALAETAREVGLKAESAADVEAALKRTDALEPGPEAHPHLRLALPRRPRARPAGRRRAASELTMLCIAVIPALCRDPAAAGPGCDSHPDKPGDTSR